MHTSFNNYGIENKIIVYDYYFKGLVIGSVIVILMSSKTNIKPLNLTIETNTYNYLLRLYVEI